MSCPSAVTVPVVALTMPQTMLISVVLAGPVGAEEREDLAAPDLQIDILERLEAGGVGLREIRDRDDGLHESAKHERGRLVRGA
jgi:hypothetical protein